MRIEALGWSLLEMLTAPLARELRRRAPEFARSWEALGGWTRDLLLPYLALIAGSISAREAGVANLPELARWPAAVACLAGIGAAWFAAPHLPQHPQPHASALEALRLEPRLALYRGHSRRHRMDTCRTTLASAAAGRTRPRGSGPHPVFGVDLLGYAQFLVDRRPAGDAHLDARPPHALRRKLTRSG